MSRNSREDQLSQPYEFVIAVDAKKEIVVVAEKEDVVAYKIFDKSKTILFSIKRDWSPAVTLFSSIIDAKFSGNAFYLKYLEGNNFKEKIEILSYEKKVKKIGLAFDIRTVEKRVAF